jgi:hypothetical protein
VTAFFVFLAGAGRDFAVLTDLVESGLPGFLAGGAGFRAGVLAFTFGAGAFAFEDTVRFGADALRAGVAFVALPLAAAVVLVFVADLGALRAGAFSDAERLTIGLGRACLPANVRFFAEDAGVF